MPKDNMTIGLISAISNNGWIGMGGNLPWEYIGKRLEGDLPRFKKITTGNGNNAVIFGRTTLESFGNKALPNRVNVVLSRDKNYKPPAEVICYQSYDEAIDALKERGIDEVWICGGASVYAQALARGRNRATIMILTKVYADYEGDVAFPKYNEVEWTVKDTQAFPNFEYNVITLGLIA